MSTEALEQIEKNETVESTEVKPKKKKKTSLSDFKVKSFMTDVKVGQVQFMKTVGG